MNDSLLLDAFREGWYHKKYASIQDWAAQNIILPASAFAMPGPFSTDKSKYMNAVFEALGNPKVRTVAISKAVQSGGSLIGQVYLPYCMNTRKGIFIYLTQGDESAKILAETRMVPILRNIPEFTSLLPKKSKQAIRNMTFTLDNCTAMIRGAKEKFVQSNSVLVCILDEVWLYKENIIEMARSRTAKFPNTFKFLLISQPDEVGTAWHSEFFKGVVHTWSWYCSKCNTYQPYEFDKQRKDGTWSGIIFDNIRVGDKRDIFKSAATARFECINCKHQIADTPTNRKMMMDSSKYVVTNVGGDPSHLSFEWNALATIDQKIAYDVNNPGPSLVVEYLQSKEEVKLGNVGPFKNFYLQKLAKWWDSAAAERQYIIAMQGYSPDSDWKSELNRVMCVDVQADHYWVLIRAWSKTCESRLLYFGRVNTLSELEELQKKYNVVDQLVFCDSGFSTTRIYQMCVEHGHVHKGTNGQSTWQCWQATKGSAQQYFNHNAINSKIVDRRIYARQQWCDPLIGQKKDGQVKKYLCPLWVYSSDSVKDILANYRNGKAAPFLTFKDDAVYNAQINGEVKRKIVDKKSGKSIWKWTQVRNDSHAMDLEGMSILAQVLMENIKAS